MNRRNLDFEIPLTREQWQQLGEAADLREDFGVLRWAPSEFAVIRVSAHTDDAPKGWTDLATRIDFAADDREVARFVYNDGRPYAQLEPPAESASPAITSAQDHALDVALERWVRDKWHGLLRDAGLHDDAGVLPIEEPNPPR